MAVGNRRQPGTWIAWQLRDLTTGLLEVISRPSRGFYRLAEEGGRFWPPVIAGLGGLVAGGADPLKAVLVAAVGGRPDGFQWFVAACVVLFPLYYAGSAAGFALVGWLLGGRRTGLGWSQLFWRFWRVLGWVSLPVLLAVVPILAYLLTSGRSILTAIAADVIPGTIPSLNLSVPGIVLVFNVVALWTMFLFIVGLRQALAGSTGRTWALIVAASLVFGALVHTPVARAVLTSVHDTYQTLGRGVVSASVSTQAYRLPSPRLPALGDLVAYSRPEGGGGINFVLTTTLGARFQSGTPRLAYIGRVIGLPGDLVAVRGGVVLRNGRPATEGHRPGLTGGQLHPAEFDLPETRVGPGKVFILPDDRSVLADLPEDAGPFVAVGRIIGRAVSVTRVYVVPAVSGPDAPPSGSGLASGTRTAEVAVVSRGDARVFTLYAGLNRAGYDEEFGQAMHPVRATVRKALAGVEPAWVQAFQDLMDRAGLWRLQGVLVEDVGPPPDFAPAKGSDTLAGELSRALAALWPAGGETLWAAYGPVHVEEAARLEAPARAAVLATLAYCREDWSPAREVVIIPNLLASSKTASLWRTETTGTAYVLVGPGDGLPLDAVVHEFCHLVVGPVMAAQAANGSLDRFDPVLDRALAAKTVASGSYRELRSYVEDCLVRALTIHIRPDDQVEARLEREEDWGFYLVRSFWQALGPYESSGRKLTNDLATILDGVDINDVLRDAELAPP